MKTINIAVIFVLLSISCFSQSIPKVISGSIKRIENFQSRFVAARNIDIWLPEGYSTNKKYSVLYMHDGQMLFDSTTTWNHQAWDVDDIASKLMNEGITNDFIVVGIFNSGATRHPEYFPQKPYESLSSIEKDTVTNQIQAMTGTKDIFKPFSDNYLKFLVTELKPFIDRNYSVYTDQAHTALAGSSMGGLISIYGICEYPGIFGGAICMSTHWPGTFSVQNNPIPEAFYSYLKKHLPDPKTHKLYFDYGDQTLDAMYPALQKKVDELVKEKGYSTANWLSKFYPGQDHSEKSWKSRLNIPLEFLFKK